MVVLDCQRDSLRTKLLDLIPRLCKKELPQQDAFSIEALIGVRFSPDDVLLVTLNDNYKNDLLSAGGDDGDDDDGGDVPIQSQQAEVIKPQQTETETEWLAEDDAQILIPKQEGGRVLLPQKLWTLLQQGKCRVKNTEEGQVITAPAAYLMPEFKQLLKPDVTPTSADHSYLTTNEHMSQTHQTKYSAGRTATAAAENKAKVPAKRGRPLKQPDPMIVAAHESSQQQLTVTTEADLTRLMQQDGVVLLNEDGTEYLPESVVHTEVVATAEAAPSSVSRFSLSRKKEHKCDICEKVLGSARSLQWHMQGLHAPPAYQCSGCGDRYPYKLKDDKCRSCTDPSKPRPRSYRCLSCNRVFKHRYLLMRHRLLCISDACNVEKSALEKYMIIEEKEQEQEGEPQQECPQCKEKFYTQDLVKAHLRDQHPGAVQCSGCGATFDNFTLLKHHKKFCQSVIKLEQTVKEPRQYICQFCGRSYNSNSKLTDHIRGIHQEPSIYCSCGAAFRWRSSLNKHKEKCPYARPEDGKTPRKPPRVKIPGEDHVCPHCQMVYKSESGLRSHIHMKHRQVAAFRCLVCARFFSSRRQLCKHRDRCPPKEKAPRRRKVFTFTCAVCKATFKNKTFLQKHVIGMHLPGRRYNCNLCGKKFRWNGGLARHRAKCKKNSTQPTEMVTELTVTNEQFVKRTPIAEYLPGGDYILMEEQGPGTSTENPTEISNEVVFTSSEEQSIAEATVTSVPTTVTAAAESDKSNIQIEVLECVAREGDDDDGYTQLEIGGEVGHIPRYIIQKVDGGVAAGSSDVGMGAEDKGIEPVMVFECALEDELAAGMGEGTELNSEQIQAIIQHSKQFRK